MSKIKCTEQLKHFYMHQRSDCIYSQWCKFKQIQMHWQMIFQT